MGILEMLKIKKPPKGKIPGTARPVSQEPKWETAGIEETKPKKGGFAGLFSGGRPITKEPKWETAKQMPKHKVKHKVKQIKTHLRTARLMPSRDETWMIKPSASSEPKWHTARFLDRRKEKRKWGNPYIEKGGYYTLNAIKWKEAKKRIKRPERITTTSLESFREEQLKKAKGTTNSGITIKTGSRGPFWTNRRVLSLRQKYGAAKKSKYMPKPMLTDKAKKINQKSLEYLPLTKLAPKHYTNSNINVFGGQEPISKDEKLGKAIRMAITPRKRRNRGRITRKPRIYRKWKKGTTYKYRKRTPWKKTKRWKNPRWQWGKTTRQGGTYNYRTYKKYASRRSRRRYIIDYGRR